MKYKILGALVIGGFIAGCGQPKIIDKCEVDYQKCSAECKITNVNKSEFSKTACEAKCKTIFVGCKTKEKVKNGYKYVKEKVSKDDNK